LLLGQLELFFNDLDERKNSRNLIVRFDAIGVSARPMAVFSGLYESPGPPLSGDARGIVPPHRDGHQNSQQRGTCFIIIELIVALAAAGVIRSE
jgi:hypothetical protein